MVAYPYSVISNLFHLAPREVPLKSQMTTPLSASIPNGRELLSEVLSLPKLSHSKQVHIQLINILGDPGRMDTSIICDTINSDAELCSKVLCVSNSGYYGRRIEIETIEDAINLIGVNEVVKISGMSAFEDECSGGLPLYNLDSDQYQLLTISAAAATECWAAMRNDPNGAIAYTVGLLSLIPRKMISSNPRVVDAPRGPETSWLGEHLEWEQNILQITFSEIAHTLFAKWKLPMAIANAIYSHHNPKLLFKEFPYARALFLGLETANKIVNGDWDQQLRASSLYLPGALPPFEKMEAVAEEAEIKARRLIAALYR